MCRFTTFSPDGHPSGQLSSIVLHAQDLHSFLVRAWRIPDLCDLVTDDADVTIDPRCYHTGLQSARRDWNSGCLCHGVIQGHSVFAFSLSYRHDRPICHNQGLVSVVHGSVFLNRRLYHDHIISDLGPRHFRTQNFTGAYSTRLLTRKPNAFWLPFR